MLALFYFHEKLEYHERVEYMVLIISVLLFNGTTIKEAWKARKLRKEAKSKLVS